MISDLLTTKIYQVEGTILVSVRNLVVSSCTGTQKKETLTNCVITPCMVMKTKGIPSCTGTPGQPPKFCQQNKHIPLKKMIIRTTCKAVEYCACEIFNSDILFTSTFITLVKSVQTSHQPTRAQSEKTT